MDDDFGDFDINIIDRSLRSEKPSETMLPIVQMRSNAWEAWQRSWMAGDWHLMQSRSCLRLWRNMPMLQRRRWISMIIPKQNYQSKHFVQSYYQFETKYDVGMRRKPLLLLSNACSSVWIHRPLMQVRSLGPACMFSRVTNVQHQCWVKKFLNQFLSSKPQ